MLTSGAKLGPYQIVAPLGRGRLGEVYRAIDTRLQHVVVVKVLPEQLAKVPKARERFEREALSVSALKHPHICAIHDIGHDYGVDYVVMEYLDGESLAHRIKKGQLPTTELLPIAIAVADALARAHQLGIYHHDLKPTNVILTKSGAKVLNLGLAGVRAVPKAGSDDRTADSAMRLAPEQLQGREGDARTDIYALGELIYEMATGTLPAATGGRDAAASKLVEDFTALPSELQGVTKKCLASDPEDRWQSASDLASELRWIKESSQPEERAVTVKHRSLREKLAWAVVAILLLGAVAMGVTEWVGRVPPVLLRAQIFQPNNVQFNFLGDESGPLVISPDGGHVVFSGVEGGTTRRLFLRSLDALPFRRCQEQKMRPTRSGLRMADPWASSRTES